MGFGLIKDLNSGYQNARDTRENARIQTIHIIPSNLNQRETR